MKTGGFSFGSDHLLRLSSSYQQPPNVAGNFNHSHSLRPSYRDNIHRSIVADKARRRLSKGRMHKQVTDGLAKSPRHKDHLHAPRYLMAALTAPKRSFMCISPLRPISPSSDIQDCLGPLLSLHRRTPLSGYGKKNLCPSDNRFPKTLGHPFIVQLRLPSYHLSASRCKRAAILLPRDAINRACQTPLGPPAYARSPSNPTQYSHEPSNSTTIINGERARPPYHTQRRTVKVEYCWHDWCRGSLKPGSNGRHNQSRSLRRGRRLRLRALGTHCANVGGGWREPFRYDDTPAGQKWHPGRSHCTHQT